MKKRILPLGIALLLVVTPTMSCDQSASGPDDDMDDEEPSYSHVRNPGASANDFLADSNFTGLEVEVDYMEGYAPNAAALDSLEMFLEQRLHKTVTVLEPTSIPAQGDSTYSANEIRELEAQHRDRFTEGSTLRAYMIIVDGRFDQANVLGIAYYNTSNAFFGEAYEDASGGVGQASRFMIEATSFRHEFGHLFGLVAIEASGTEMQTEHQDEANGHHCDNDQCLMYYAIESTDLFGNVFDGEIPALDANCIADLQANGGR